MASSDTRGAARRPRASGEVRAWGLTVSGRGARRGGLAPACGWQEGGSRWDHTLLGVRGAHRRSETKRGSTPDHRAECGGGWAWPLAPAPPLVTGLLSQIPEDTQPWLRGFLFTFWKQFYPWSCLSLVLFRVRAACCMLSPGGLFATPYPVAHQAPLSWDFAGKNTGMGCHFLSRESSGPRDRTGISWIGSGLFTSEPPGKRLKPASQHLESHGISFSRCPVPRWAGFPLPGRRPAACLFPTWGVVSQPSTVCLSIVKGASLVTQLVKNPPAMWETWVWSLGWEDPLEKGKATHSSILAWRIPWTV